MVVGALTEWLGEIHGQVEKEWSGEIAAGTFATNIVDGGGGYHTTFDHTTSEYHCGRRCNWRRRKNNRDIQIFLEDAEATDVVDPKPVITNDAPDLLPLGQTVVTFTATDATGNQSTAQGTVNVVDTTRPLLAVPGGLKGEGDVTGGVYQTNTAVRAFLEGSTAMDIVDPNPVVADDAPNLFPVGDTVVTFTATDASGNQATAQATVTIVDTTPPLVTAPRGITVGGDLTRGVFQTNVAVHSFLKAARAIDIVDPDPVITNDAPDILSLGDTVITFTAVDASIQSNSRCQMLHRVSRDATVGERVELWEGWHPWFRRSMASS